MSSKTGGNIYGGPLLDLKKHDYAVLKKLFCTLKLRYDDIYFSLDTLQGLGVKATELHLDSDTAATSAGEKQFFQPKPASEYAKLPRKEFNPATGEKRDFHKANAFNINLQNYFGLEISEEEPTEDEIYLLMFSSWEEVAVPGNDKLGGWESDSTCKEKYKWRGDHAYAVDDENDDTPHMIYFTMHGINPDAGAESKIARTELLLLIDVMMANMDNPAYFNNTIYPVLLVPVFGDKLRLIQGYFEGGKLHIQYSPFISYSPFDKSGFDLFCRWILGGPVGDTTTPTGNLQQTDLTAIRNSQKNVKLLRGLRS